MRKFIINVNGNSYEVEVEEVKDGVAAAPSTVQKTSVQPAAPVQKSEPAAASTAKPVEPPKAAASVPAGGLKITSPMPGNIWDIKVSTGDTIKKGDVVLILEAMKMENEIMAPKDGKIASIHVTKGATVNSGDVLVVMD